MNRRPRLTDAALRAALSPARDVAAPPDLLEAIAMDIRNTPQARHPLRAPGLPQLWGIGGTARGRRLAWAVAALALLAALVGAAFIGARLLLPPACTGLTATALDTLTPETGLYNRIVTDGAGKLWAVSAGHLTRFDPETGLRRAWRLGGESAHETVVAASREGGVWLWAGEAVCRFDGNRFTDEIPTDTAAAIELAEAPDGALWANDDELGLRRWDGANWLGLPGGRPSERAGAFLALSADDVWVANPAIPGPYGPSSRGLGVSHLVDGRWINYAENDAASLGRAIGAIKGARDGSIWVMTDPELTAGQIARFDGQAWTAIDDPGFQVAILEAASDGGMWAAAATMDEGTRVAIAHYTDGAWTTISSRDHPAGEAIGYLADTPAGVLVGTDVGLFQFEEDFGFVIGWPRAATGPIGVSAGFDEHVLAISADEAWLADDRGLWHFAEEAWQGPIEPGDLRPDRINGLAAGTDGSLWVAADTGVAVLRGSTWTTAWEEETRAIAVDQDGTAWIGGPSKLVGLSFVGAEIETRTIPCPIEGFWRLAVAKDGSVYLAEGGYGLRLAWFDGEQCAQLDPPADYEARAVGGLAADPRGEVVVAYLLGEATGAGTSTIDRMRSLVRLDAGRWTLIEGPELVPFLSWELAVAPNGDIWRPVDLPENGFERYDGERWITVLEDVIVWRSISIAPDGAVWYLGPYGVQRVLVEGAP